MTQGVSKRKDLMKISKVIFHIKPIPSHPWWECKNVEENAKKRGCKEKADIEKIVIAYKGTRKRSCLFLLWTCRVVWNVRYIVESQLVEQERVEATRRLKEGTTGCRWRYHRNGKCCAASRWLLYLWSIRKSTTSYRRVVPSRLSCHSYLHSFSSSAAYNKVCYYYKAIIAPSLDN